MVSRIFRLTASQCLTKRVSAYAQTFSEIPVCVLLIYKPMQPAGGSTTTTPAPSSDIVFSCAHCSTSFVVDAAAAGMTLTCENCRKPTTVPTPAPAPAPENAVKISDLQNQLKENES